MCVCNVKQLCLVQRVASCTTGLVAACCVCVCVLSAFEEMCLTSSTHLTFEQCVFQEKRNKGVPLLSVVRLRALAYEGTMES